MSPKKKSTGLNRRSFLKGIGGSAVAVTALSSNSPYSISRDADASLVLVAGAVAGAALGDYILRKYDVYDDDSPPEGLTASALTERAYETGLKRKSTNESTMVDNQNIINFMPEKVFGDAKARARQEIANGSTKSAVKDAALNEANKQFATIEKNLMRSWEETVNEYFNIRSTINAHSSVSGSDVFAYSSGFSPGSLYIQSASTSSKTHTCQDGTDFTFQEVTLSRDNGKSSTFDFKGTYNDGGTADTDQFGIHNPDTGDTVIWCDVDNTWQPTWTKLQDKIASIQSDITLWVDNVYDSVKSGDLDVSDVFTPDDLTSVAAQEHPNSRAILDLMAMNVPADFDNMTTIRLEDGTHLTGLLATSDESASSLQPGDQIDAPSLSEDYYIAYDKSKSSFEWTDYDSSKGVDGGYVWFTSNPQEFDKGTVTNSVEYHINTTSGETAIVSPDAYTETTDGSGNTVYEFDLNSQLDDTITGIDDIMAYPTTSESSYEAIMIRQMFEVVNIEGDASQVTFSRSRDPQTDNNYIRKSEFEQLRSDYKDLVDKYEKSQSASAGGGFLDLGFNKQELLVGAAGIVGLGWLLGQTN